MDPLSQAVIGSMAAITKKTNKVTFKKAALWGALAGMAPDLDIFIRSGYDPLFNVEYHRHFTHSLAFVPIGALIVSYFLKLFKVDIRTSYPYTFLGYATHGLLDSLTNYGTQLFIPFSSIRVAFNTIAVIDPLCTIPLVILVGLAIKKKRAIFNTIAIIYFFLYAALGFYQNSRVENHLRTVGLISKDTDRFLVKPTIFNGIVWRVVISKQGYNHFYAVRSIPFGEIKIYPKSESAKIATEVEVRQKINEYNSSKFEYDYERFKYFTNGHLHWGENGTLVDSRYSMLPYSSMPIWYLLFHDRSGHADFVTRRGITPEQRKEFLQILKGF